MWLVTRMGGCGLYLERGVVMQLDRDYLCISAMFKHMYSRS